MALDGMTAWPRGLCSASPGVDTCDAPPPSASPSCSSSPRQTPLRPFRPPSRWPVGHRGPNCSAAAVAITTSTKAEQASRTCCGRRSTSSIATPTPTFAYEFNDDAAPPRFAPIEPPVATQLSELTYLFDLS